MAVLKRLGIVKNLNFKVGHAAIVLLHRESGTMAYYDFGRYITPRGYGRARSAESDPRLRLFTKATITGNNEIGNIHAILEELHQLEFATHGGGRMFFSLSEGISYAKATTLANRLVSQGLIKYGAIAKGHNSCSRFVAQTLSAGMKDKHPAKATLIYPESIKPSPMSNVVNAVTNGTIYCYYENSLTKMKMNRWQSLRLQIDLLLHNFSSGKAKQLPCDRTPGCISEPSRPSHLPKSAQWLGGIGEGAWFFLEQVTKAGSYAVIKYTSRGDEEYRVNCEAGQPIEPHVPYQFTYHLHYQRYILQQGQTQITLNAMPIAAERLVTEQQENN